MAALRAVVLVAVLLICVNCEKSRRKSKPYEWCQQITLNQFDRYVSNMDGKYFLQEDVLCAGEPVYKMVDPVHRMSFVYYWNDTDFRGWVGGHSDSCGADYIIRSETEWNFEPPGYHYDWEVKPEASEDWIPAHDVHVSCDSITGCYEVNIDGEATRRWLNGRYDSISLPEEDCGPETVYYRVVQGLGNVYYFYHHGPTEEEQYWALHTTPCGEEYFAKSVVHDSLSNNPEYFLDVTWYEEREGEDVEVDMIVYCGWSIPGEHDCQVVDMTNFIDPDMDGQYVRQAYAIWDNSAVFRQRHHHGQPHYMYKWRDIDFLGWVIGHKVGSDDYIARTDHTSDEIWTDWSGEWEVKDEQEEWQANAGNGACYEPCNSVMVSGFQSQSWLNGDYHTTGKCNGEEQYVKYDNGDSSDAYIHFDIDSSGQYFWGFYDDRCMDNEWEQAWVARIEVEERVPYVHWISELDVRWIELDEDDMEVLIPNGEIDCSYYGPSGDGICPVIDAYDWSDLFSASDPDGFYQISHINDTCNGKQYHTQLGAETPLYIYHCSEQGQTDQLAISPVLCSMDEDDWLGRCDYQYDYSVQPGIPGLRVENCVAKILAGPQQGTWTDTYLAYMQAAEGCANMTLQGASIHPFLNGQYRPRKSQYWMGCNDYRFWIKAVPDMGQVFMYRRGDPDVPESLYWVVDWELCGEEGYLARTPFDGLFPDMVTDYGGQWMEYDGNEDVESDMAFVCDDPETLARTCSAKTNRCKSQGLFSWLPFAATSGLNSGGALLTGPFTLVLISTMTLLGM